MPYEGAMFWLANTTLSDRCEPPLPCFSGENPACVLCVCVCVCVCDCVVFFVKGDFLKIRTQFAVKMLLCIIYILFFSSIQTSPKEMLWVEVASINNPYFLVHLLHAEV